MTNHITVDGLESDDLGYVWITCECGERIGPMPSSEEAIDLAMDHAYQAGLDYAP